MSLPDRRIRVGVIGAGSWALSSHLPHLASRDDVEIVAVHRQGDPTHLADIQRRFAVSYGHTDWRDLLKHNLDVVVVSSPTAGHAEQAVAAIESGAHVLVEKPFTLTPDEAWRTVDAAQRLRRHLVVAFGWNFKPMIQAAKRLMADPGIGEVETLSLQMSSTTRDLLTGTGSYADADPVLSPESSTWTNPAISGGGYGQAQLTHAFALALGLTGLRVQEVFALMSAPIPAPVELHAALTLRLDNGAIGTVIGSSGHAGAGGDRHQLKVDLVGSAGQLRVDVEREQVWLYRPNGPDLKLPLAPGDGSYDCAGPVHTIIDLAQGHAAENPAPGELGARTVEALTLAYRSAQTGRPERRA